VIKINLFWLISWYARHCNGVWEKTHGIEIETLGNPGWRIKISLEGTELEDKKFQKVSVDRTENDWLFCKVENSLFDSACSTFNVSEGLKIFKNWAEDNSESEIFETKNELNDDWYWIINWYHSQCDGYWEGSFGIQIESREDQGWNITICARETELEDKKFQEFSIQRIETDWVHCKIEDGYFKANCGTFNVAEVFQIFRNWAES